jgi:uncharacterized protein YbjT (DUF2867 family)
MREDTMLDILVTGATGQQGGSVARILIDHGHGVRALTRKPGSPQAIQLEKRGAQIFEGSFDDSDSLKRALHGVDAAFVVGTPFELGTDAETKQGIAVVDAVQQTGVGHLIYTSVGDADQNTGIPHFDSKYRVEQHIKNLGIPHTIVAPVFFYENMFAPFMLPGLQQGTLAMALPADRTLQSVALENIGQFAVHAIENRDAFLGKRVNLASDELTGTEYAAVLSRASGRTIQYFPVPIEKVREQSEDMALMFEWFDHVGYSVDLDGLRRDYPAIGWKSFEEWAGEKDWKVLDRAS